MPAARTQHPPLERTSLLKEAGPKWSAGTRRFGSIVAGGIPVGAATAILLAHLQPGGWLWGIPVLAGAARAAAIRLALRARFLRMPLLRDFTQLDKLEDRTLVRLRGRVKADQLLTGIVSERSAIAQRLIFTVQASVSGMLERKWRLVYEASHDFTLLDEADVGVPVRVTDAEMVGRTSQRRVPIDEYAKGRIRNLPLPPAPAGWPTHILDGSEQLIVDGQEIEVVGTKTREASPDHAALPRETPWRTAIATGHMPVVIFV